MKNILRQFSLFIIIPCLLNGCVSKKVASLNKDIDLELEKTEGYLLLGVDTNYSLYQIQIYGEKNITLTEDDLQTGHNYILIDLPEGDYRIAKVRSSRYRYYKFDDEADENMWNFSVEANVISYVGHLKVEQRGIIYTFRSSLSQFFSGLGSFELVNRSSSAQEFLEEKFPNILSHRDIKYKGPGVDDFFDVVKNDPVSR